MIFFLKYIHLLIGSVNPSTLILFKAIFDNVCPLHLHLNFQINLCKKEAVILIGVVLNMRLHLNPFLSEDECGDFFSKDVKACSLGTYSSVVECLPSTSKALDLIPTNGQTNFFLIILYYLFHNSDITTWVISEFFRAY